MKYMSSSIVLTSAKKNSSFLAKINRAMCYSKLLTDDPGFSEKSSEGNLFLKMPSTVQERKKVLSGTYFIEIE